ncbi:MAG: XTP/dITP diphosphatase [Deltaproteobacteria bacterium]|nr:XTP/dITP diphosphatase [Deltaproteobacteria bacterium]
MTRLIVATGNRGKTKEINSIVADLGFEVSSLLDVENPPEIIEDGDTFEANAVKKAQTVADFYQCASLADDSGLVVDALDGAPGVYSARYGGHGLNDTQRYEKLLDALKDVPAPRRTARFECALAFVVPGDVPHIFRGTVEGHIALAPRGTNGFGYDPVFIPNGRSESMAELDNAQKRQLSHRGQALDSFAAWLQKNK